MPEGNGGGNSVRISLKTSGDCELGVNGLAERFYFHPVYLNRLFKKEKGVFRQPVYH